MKNYAGVLQMQISDSYISSVGIPSGFVLKYMMYIVNVSVHKR